MPDKIENFNPNSYYNSPAPITQNFAFNIPSTIDASNIISKSTNTINAFKLAQNLKNFTNIGNIAGAAGTVVSSLLGDKREYSGTYGNVARTADSIYDTASDVISVIPGWGTAVSGIMKGAGALNQVMGKLGNSNDGMTVLDALLSSKFINLGGLNPVSWVANGFGKKSISMENLDFISLERLNSNMDAYSGSLNTYESAMKKANKKYSLFSNGARHGANGLIRKANTESDLRLLVYDNNLLSLIRGMQQTSINNQGYLNLINGDLRTAAFGRKGLKLVKRSRLKNIINLSNEKILENLLDKNKLEEVEIPQNEQINLDNKEVIDSFLKGGKSEYKKIKSDKAYYDKDSDTVYYTNDEDLVHEGFHARPDSALLELLRPYYENLNDEKILNFGGNLLFVKRFEEDPGHFYSPEELGARVSAAKFRTKGNNYTPEFFKYLRTNENLYGDNMRDLLYMYNDENLSKIFNIGNTQAFKQGGQMNVIPEGALHARKNNMEGAGEDFTAKGIPVVDNNGEQQAEIEKEEWTMTKELTDDVEKWYKEYYKEDTSQKDKDELAIKCGKRITKELLHNTDDRANLIAKMLEEEE